MSSRLLRPVRVLSSLVLLAMLHVSEAQQPGSAGAQPPLGTPPLQAALPRVEFAFEFHVTLSGAVMVGQTAFGHRQYIPITGGSIQGPKLTGEVLPGGWDYQLGLADGCSMLSADYFIRAQDGTVIHVLNEGMFCAPSGPTAARSFFRPRFEAPKGANEWLTRATFVASLEVDPPTPQTSSSAPRPLGGIRLKFYQIK